MLNEETIIVSPSSTQVAQVAQPKKYIRELKCGDVIKVFGKQEEYLVVKDLFIEMYSGGGIEPLEKAYAVKVSKLSNDRKQLGEPIFMFDSENYPGSWYYPDSIVSSNFEILTHLSPKWV